MGGHLRKKRWVSVTMAQTRVRAFTAAAGAYQGLPDRRGQGPRQCRVGSVAQLIREGGDRAVGLADAEIARRDRN